MESKVKLSSLENFKNSFIYKIIQNPFRLNNLLFNKYGDIEEDFNLLYLDAILFSKNCHFSIKYREYLIWDYVDEFLKRYYNKKESYERLPRIANYYKNYLKFFCNPFFKEFRLNEIIQIYGDDKAKIYYKNNYGIKGKNHEKDALDNNIENEQENIKNEENNEKLYKSIIFNTTARGNIENHVITKSSQNEKNENSKNYDSFFFENSFVNNKNEINKKTVQESLMNLLNNINSTSFTYDFINDENSSKYKEKDNFDIKTSFVGSNKIKSKTGLNTKKSIINLFGNQKTEKNISNNQQKYNEKINENLNVLLTKKNDIKDKKNLNKNNIYNNEFQGNNIIHRQSPNDMQINLNFKNQINEHSNIFKKMYKDIIRESTNKILEKQNILNNIQNKSKNKDKDKSNEKLNLRLNSNDKDLIKTNKDREEIQKELKLKTQNVYNIKKPNSSLTKNKNLFSTKNSTNNFNIEGNNNVVINISPRIGMNMENNIENKIDFSPEKFLYDFSNRITSPIMNSIVNINIKPILQLNNNNYQSNVNIYNTNNKKNDIDKNDPKKFQNNKNNPNENAIITKFSEFKNNKLSLNKSNRPTSLSNNSNKSKELSRKYSYNNDITNKNIFNSSIKPNLNIYNNISSTNRMVKIIKNSIDIDKKSQIKTKSFDQNSSQGNVLNSNNQNLKSTNNNEKNIPNKIINQNPEILIKNSLNKENLNNSLDKNTLNSFNNIKDKHKKISYEIKEKIDNPKVSDIDSLNENYSDIKKDEKNNTNFNFQLKYETDLNKKKLKNISFNKNEENILNTLYIEKSLNSKNFNSANFEINNGNSKDSMTCNLNTININNNLFNKININYINNNCNLRNNSNSPFTKDKKKSNINPSSTDNKNENKFISLNKLNNLSNPSTSEIISHILVGGNKFINHENKNSTFNTKQTKKLISSLNKNNQGIGLNPKFIDHNLNKNSSKRLEIHPNENFLVIKPNSNSTKINNNQNKSNEKASPYKYNSSFRDKTENKINNNLTTNLNSNNSNNNITKLNNYLLNSNNLISITNLNSTTKLSINKISQSLKIKNENNFNTIKILNNINSTNVNPKNYNSLHFNHNNNLKIDKGIIEKKNTSLSKQNQSQSKNKSDYSSNSNQILQHSRNKSNTLFKNLSNTSNLLKQNNNHETKTIIHNNESSNILNMKLFEFIKNQENNMDLIKFSAEKNKNFPAGSIINHKDRNYNESIGKLNKYSCEINNEEKKIKINTEISKAQSFINNKIVNSSKNGDNILKKKLVNSHNEIWLNNPYIINTNNNVLSNIQKTSKNKSTDINNFNSNNKFSSLNKKKNL